MDELIILLIQGIAKMFGGEQPKKPRQFQPAPPGQAGQPRLPENMPPALQQQLLRLMQARQGKAAPARSTRTSARRAVPARAPISPTNVAPVLPDAPPGAPPLAPSARATQRAAASSTAATVAGHGGAAGVNAAALRRWLTPSIMQKQFILTEILQPPLALREEQ